MRARDLAVLCAGLLLAACQTPPPPVYHVEQGRTYDQPKAVVWRDLRAFLERQQIAVTAADFERGMIAAERHHFEDQGWADCQRARVVDNSSNNRRPTRAWAVDRDLALQVALAEVAGATRVTLDASFTEQQVNPYSNLPFTQRCRSKGVLEGALLEAL